jgi:hypothetical protein
MPTAHTDADVSIRCHGTGVTFYIFKKKLIKFLIKKKNYYLFGRIFAFTMSTAQTGADVSKKNPKQQTHRILLETHIVTVIQITEG